jgi:hypothetical protein
MPRWAVSYHRRGTTGSYDRRVPTSPSTSRRRVHGLWLVPLVVGLSAVTSCGDEAHTSAPHQAIGSGVQPRRTGPAAHLLAAGKMPTVGADWAGVDTTSNDLQVLGPCHPVSLVDIGATSAVRRTWNADGSLPRAVQVVARFADNKSAWRAHEVLDSWHADCAGQVDGKVGDRRDVTVSTGVAETYRVAQGDRATDLGILRKGEYLSVVALVGSEARLPDDSSVARAAVKRIAATF